MSTFKQIAEDLKQKLIQLEQTRIDRAFILMSDAYELIVLRVQNTGVNADGSKMPGYSTTPSFYAAFLDPSNFNGTAKIKKFKDDYKKGKNTGSYKEQRKAYGLPSEFRNLTFDGAMFNSIRPIVKLTDTNVVEVFFDGTDELTRKKIAGNIKNAKTNFLRLNEEEREILSKANRARIAKIFDL
jgi:hypothetical protein